MKPTAVEVAPLSLLLSPLAVGAMYFACGRFAAIVIGGLVIAGLAALMMWPGWCRAVPRGDVQAGDCFVVFSFGLGPAANGQPTAGKSNLALAEWLIAHNPAKKPAIVQEAVYLALRELEQSRPGLLDGWPTFRLPERDGFYIDTNGAAFQTDTVLNREQFKKPVLVAHDLQLWRMARAFENIGITNVIVPEMPPTPFDPDSVQHCGTRYQACWLPREAFAARPLTLAPQATLVCVSGMALLYGAAFAWLRRKRAVV